MTRIQSVNYHLWEPCNMRCKFCFATFQDVKNTILPKGHLPQAEALKVVQAIADFGFQKITFAGGEPTLCPWLFELVQLAKSNGLTTMLVTNGTRLTTEFLRKYESCLDWITLSIDSLNDEANLISGRAVVGKRVITRQKYKEIIQRIHESDIRLKINTVVHQYNYQEDFNAFIIESQPERWKIMQVLPIKGENDACIDRFKISESQFTTFVKRHDKLSHQGIPLIPENNDSMIASYAMIDPAGRFFCNFGNVLNYSKPILEIGAAEAYQQVIVDQEKFEARGGVYDWT